MRTLKFSIVLLMGYLVLFTTSAKADSAVCTVTGVGFGGWTANNAGVLVSSKLFWLSCSNGNWYYANGGGNPSTAACPVNDSDTIRSYISLGESAKLSGKTITIYSNVVTCSLPTNVGNGTTSTWGTFQASLITGLQFTGN